MKKRLLCWIIFICSVLFACTPQTSGVIARAEIPASGSYACVLEDAFFYDEPRDTEGLFLLPKTYYVKLVEYGEDYSKIEYGDGSAAPSLTGYAKTSLLTFVPYLPTRPYLSYTFEVKYTIGNDVTIDSSFLTQITAKCVYYGDYEIGSKLYCYVLRGEEFGYVPKPSSLSFEENGEYASYLASLESEESETKEKSSSPAQIALLVALCLLVPVLAALILKPPRRPPYETDEY